MYTNYSKMGQIDPEEQAIEITGNADAATIEVDEEPTNITPVVEPEPEIEELLLGKVTGCPKLNVRQEPIADGMIIGILPISSEVMIDQAESTEDFYKVCTASGMEGYCMKRFITIQ